MAKQEEIISLAATARTEVGTGAAIRERLEGRIPGILYGGDKESVAISVERADLRTALSTEHGENALVTLTVGDETVPVIVKDMQRHKVRRTVTHFDLQRVLATQKIVLEIPLYLIGTAREVVAAGGMVERNLSYINIKVRADSIPERIEADISHMTIGDTLHVSDLELPPSVEVLTDAGEAVASADLTRAAVVAQGVTDEELAEGEDGADGEEASD